MSAFLVQYINIWYSYPVMFDWALQKFDWALQKFDWALAMFVRVFANADLAIANYYCTLTNGD